MKVKGKTGTESVNSMMEAPILNGCLLVYCMELESSAKVLSNEILTAGQCGLFSIFIEQLFINSTIVLF